jgi:hypothetical protein
MSIELPPRHILRGVIGNWRRVLSVLLLTGILVAGYRPMFLSFLVGRIPKRPAPIDGIDRRPLRERADSTPPDLLQFLQSVRAQTNKRDTIGLVLPPPFDGFSYVYWRGSYVLAGRTVLLPPSARSVCGARFVATWENPFACDRQAVAWEGSGGRLLRSVN